MVYIIIRRNQIKLKFIKYTKNSDITWSFDLPFGLNSSFIVNFKYGFFADMEFDQRKKLDHVLHAITDLTNSVRIFGVYQKGKMQKG